MDYSHLWNTPRDKRVDTVAQILYMICFAATSYWPATADLTFPVLGVYIICIAWIIRGWMIPAFATLAAVGILLVNSSSRMSSQIISTLVMFTLISSTGLVLRSLVRKIHTSAQQLRAAQEASTAIRADLATQLHDTIAKIWLESRLPHKISHSTIPISPTSSFPSRHSAKHGPSNSPYHLGS